MGRQAAPRRRRVGFVSIAALVMGAAIASQLVARPLARQGQTAPPPAQSDASRAVLDKDCVGCHNQRLRTAGFALDNLDIAHPGTNPDAWERVVAKLRAGSMPPPGRPRPDSATYRSVAGWLEGELDRAWAQGPN